MDETLLALNDLVRAGKVRYLGASNICGWQLQKIADYSKFMGLNRWVSLQVSGLPKLNIRVSFQVSGLPIAIRL